MFNQNQINQILQIAKKAGDSIMQYHQGHKTLSITNKDDGTIVTEADLVANEIIVTNLANLFPDIAIISEENSQESNVKALQSNQYFMIDPIDGTSSFVKKSDEFTVNIALISNFKSVFGVIYVPAKDLMYFTNENGKSIKISDFSNPKIAKAQEIHVSKDKSNPKIICTKRELERSQIINDLKNRNIKIDRVTSVSSSYKFCLIAEGRADIYVRRIIINAWDIAAGHAIVVSAGGNMINIHTGKELEYRLSSDFRIPIFEAF